METLERVPGHLPAKQLHAVTEIPKTAKMAL